MGTRGESLGIHADPVEEVSDDQSLSVSSFFFFGAAFFAGGFLGAAFFGAGFLAASESAAGALVVVPSMAPAATPAPMPENAEQRASTDHALGADIGVGQRDGLLGGRLAAHGNLHLWNPLLHK